MKKEEKTSRRQVKKTSAIAVALVCLIVGFGIGFLSKNMIGTDRTVRKRTLRQQVFQSPHTQDNRFKQLLSLHLKIGDNPDDAAAWISLGHTYFDMDAYENAIQAYRKYLELNPKNADVWTDLGVMLRRSGKPEEALKAFDKAAAIDPGHRQSRFNKGVVFLHDLQKPGEAIKAWEELLKIYPDAKSPTGRSLKELVEQLRGRTENKNNR